MIDNKVHMEIDNSNFMVGVQNMLKGKGYEKLVI